MAQQMPNPVELYEAAVQGFRQTLSGVQANQLSNTTPCTEWNVQALINHNLKVAGFALGVLQENINVNPMDVAGDLPAEGAVAALDAGVAKILEFVKRPGAAAEEIDTPFGHMTRAAFLMNPFTDLLIHKWDLAKGTNQNATLDSGLVEACYTAIAPHMPAFREMETRGNHIFGPEVTVPGSAIMQDKLIGIAGRQP